MKQVFKLVKFFLIILLVSFTSCSNDLSEKNKEISFSFELPQEKINRATNENSDNTLWNINAQIENTKDIIQKIEKTAYSGETVTLTFKEIIVGQEVKINIDLTKKDEKTPTYTGSSDWFIVKNGNNKINITLNKIVEDKIPDEEKPDDNEDTNDDDEPDEENNDSPVIIIVDATSPEIITQPQSIVEIATPNSTNNSIIKKLSLSAKSTDKGNLSFIWQEKNPDDIWQNFEPITTTTYSDRIESSIGVTVEKGKSKTFKCIITNTNNLVNGNKTATIETNEVTVAYIEGQLTSIEAQYIGEYEKFNYEDFYTNGKVTVTETYTSGNTNTEVNVTADKSRYTISQKNINEKAIGYVPYTVKNNINNISTEIRVPVKYELNANDFIIKSDTNDDENIGYSEDNPEKIPEHTYKTIVTLTAKDSLPQFIYETEELEQASEYNIIGNGISYHWIYRSVNDTNNVNNANTLTPNSTWCIGEEITLYYYVQFCPWVISLTGTSIVDLNNLTENTEYTLTATNEADTTSAVTWSSTNTSFTINNNTLTTPEASTESDLTATITAKVDNKEVGSVTATVKKVEPLGSQANPFTNWNDLKTYLETNSSVVTEIYVKGNLQATETAYTYRPVTIIPVGEVTITRTTTNTSNLFDINADFTLQGSENSKFILQGDSTTENTSPLINCTSDAGEVNLQYCTLQNAYCESYPYGATLYASNGGTINMSNCTVQNNKGVAVVLNTNSILNNCTFTKNEAISSINASAIYVNDETANIQINNCTFSNNINKETGGDLGIEKSSNVSITGTTFSPTETGYNIYTYQMPSLTLSGELSIPKLYFDNYYSDSTLGIKLGENLSLNNSTPITIYSGCYTNQNSNNTVDNNFFELYSGQTLPDGVFALGDENYILKDDGTIIQKLSGILVNSAEELKNKIESETAEVIIIDSDITLTDCINIARDVQIAANTDVTLTSNIQSNNMFNLSSNLTLGGGAGTLTIKAPVAKHAIIATNSEKTITIKDGVKFTNCSSCCISLKENDTLTIEGGEFSGNTMTPIAIANNSSAVINMSGGKIENNSATNMGAGIIVNNGTLNITGGTIQNNVLNGSNNGASIYISNGTGTATINENLYMSTITQNIIDGNLQ